jgi:hypothetical protein
MAEMGSSEGDPVRRGEIIDARQARPFQTFRIYVSDGGMFDIRHPEMLMVTRHSAVVGLPGNGGTDSGSEGYPAIERHTALDLLHITRIEQIDSSPQQRA